MADFPQLLRRYVEQSDQAAFAELVRGHVNLVYSIALRQACGDGPLAEEITQGVFALLARKAPGLIGRSTLNGWLYYTALLSANAAIRRESRRRVREHRALLEETIMNPESEKAPRDPDWETARPALDQAIGRLTDRERDAVLLRFFENRSFPEVGRLLRVSEDAARMRVDRALEKLRNQLVRQGSRVTSAAGLAALLAESGATAAPAGLAASAGAGGVISGAGLIAFMTTTKASVGLTGLLILAMGTALYETVQMRILPTEIAVADHGYRQMQNRLQSDQEHAAPSRASGPAANRVLSSRAGAGRPNPLFQDFAENPAHEARFVQNQVMQLRLNAKPLAVAMGLSSADYERLMGSAEQWKWQRTDINIAGTSLGLPPGDPALRWMTLQADLDFFRQVEGVTGISALTMGRKGEDLNSLSSLAAALYDTDSPLTLGQANQLSEIMKARHNEDDWSDVLAQAGSVLGPAQLPALRAVADQLQFRSSVNQARAGRNGNAAQP